MLSTVERESCLETTHYHSPHSISSLAGYPRQRHPTARTKLWFRRGILAVSLRTRLLQLVQDLLRKFEIRSPIVNRACTHWCGNRLSLVLITSQSVRSIELYETIDVGNVTQTYSLLTCRYLLDSARTRMCSEPYFMVLRCQM